MTEDPTKLRVKLGGAEIEYEGNREFLKEEVLPKVNQILDMVRDRVELAAPPAGPMIAATVNDGMLPEAQQPTAMPDHSTNTIATLLKATSGTDLAIAAAAKLTLVDAKATVTRSEILGEMRQAPSFYKQTMRSNLSNYLGTLVKADRLRLISKDTYAISNTERQALEAALADTH